MKLRFDTGSHMEQELIHRAIKAYIALCTRRNWLYQQPSKNHTEVKGETIRLANCNGTLAVYRLVSGKLHRLTP